jgi:hypothetical protein
MCRFPLHRQGQDSPVSTPCRGSGNYWSHSRVRATGLGYRPGGSNVKPANDRRKSLLTARSDRVSALGKIR